MQDIVCTMNITDTMANAVLVKRPLRRQYSQQMKIEIVQQCRQSGASVAGVALSHGINANIVHRWLREHSGAIVVAQPQAFIPLKLEQPMQQGSSASAPSADIRVEVRRGANAIVVSWPLEGANSCAAWLREWLR